MMTENEQRAFGCLLVAACLIGIMAMFAAIFFVVADSFGDVGKVAAVLFVAAVAGLLLHIDRAARATGRNRGRK